MLFVAALFVAAFGCGLARMLRPDPPGARLPPSWLDLLCIQLVMIVCVFVGAALLAALPAATFVVFLMIGLFLSFVKAPGLKNEATLLEHFPLVKKSDGFDLKMLAGLLSVEQDLLTDFVFENGFDETATRTVAAVDAMNRAMKQPEACTVVAVNDAATVAAMPMLRFWFGFAPSWRLCPLRAVTRPLQGVRPHSPCWKPPLLAAAAMRFSSSR